MRRKMELIIATVLFRDHERFIAFIESQAANAHCLLYLTHAFDFDISYSRAFPVVKINK